MAESRQPSQQRQILQKLDDLGTMVGHINVKMSSLETQVRMQPQIDDKHFQKLDNKISANGFRIDKLENQNTWLFRTIIGLSFATFVQLVIALSNI